jgi:hypothetical protein
MQERIKVGSPCQARSKWLDRYLPAVVLAVHDTAEVLLAAHANLPPLTYTVLFRAGLWLETEVRARRDCCTRTVWVADATPGAGVGACGARAGRADGGDGGAHVGTSG